MYKELAKKALEVRKNSYVPYSKFRVGACLLTKENKMYTGCNIESVSFSPTNCAERTAFFKAISEGERDFKAIAIAGGLEGKELDYCYPCGVCRQVMLEFCEPTSFEIIIVKNENDFKIHSLKEIMPYGFSPKELDKN